MRWVPILFPFYTQKNLGTKQVSNFYKVNDKVAGLVFKLREFGTRAHAPIPQK